MSGTSREASWMSGSCGEAHPYVREWSGDPPSCLRVVGGPPGCPGVVESRSQMSGSSREYLTDVWEWSRCLPGCPGVVKRPSQMSSSCREALTDV